MKLIHELVSMPTNPEVGKVYGARAIAVKLTGTSVTVQWKVYTHKHRAKKKSATHQSVPA